MYQENQALSDKLNQPQTLNKPLVELFRENGELSIEQIVVAMAQVQLKEIQIVEINLEIDELNKSD